MVEKGLFKQLSNKYGHYASWAVWCEAGLKPKSNVGDLTIFDTEHNPGILEIVNPNIVMVGLNISRPIEFTFGNFHDKRSQSQDYKIRYAFKDTIFWGAYMTDIIKDFEQLISGKVASYLKLNREFEIKNVELFRNELLDIKANNPLIIALGNHSFNIINKYFHNEFQIIKIPHYSMQISKENYKLKIEKLLENV